MPKNRRISPEADSHAAIDIRLRDSYELLEKTRPDAITGFRTYLAAEQDRARRFVARLSLRRREEYLATFDADEHRLRVFARWLKTEGGAFVSTEVQQGAAATGHGDRVSFPTA